jgi:hypothetical protein
MLNLRANRLIFVLAIVAGGFSTNSLALVDPMCHFQPNLPQCAVETPVQELVSCYIGNDPLSIGGLATDCDPGDPDCTENKPIDVIKVTAQKCAEIGGTIINQ